MLVGFDVALAAARDENEKEMVIDMQYGDVFSSGALLQLFGALLFRQHARTLGHLLCFYATALHIDASCILER